jgi:ferritin
MLASVSDGNRASSGKERKTHMISKKMVKALNRQINAEMYSAYLYFAMSTYATSIGMKGMAHWLFVQGQEELTHAFRQFQYVNSQGEQVIFAAIAQPPANFDSPLHVFQEVLKHEQKVTAGIHELANLATAEKDHASGVFLQWFVTEQVEEEQNVHEMVGKLKLVGNNGGGLFMIDKELETRQFVLPPGLVLG